jgi:DASS family divalent anion:Na+ symporter
MFLTAMAANPLVVEAAAEILDIDFDWTSWFLGGLVPGLVGLALLPLFLHQIARPELATAERARKQAARQLRSMGPWTKQQVLLGGVFVLMLLLWSTASIHRLPATWVALLGVVVLLLCGVEKWREMASNAAAWDTLVWLGGLLTMAVALKQQGVISWLARIAEAHVSGTSAVFAGILLAVIYFYSMYAFSMLTGHITAMVGAFFIVALGTGTPPLLIVPLLAYFSSLCGCLTNYSTGPLIIYFGLGYVPATRWFRIGLIVSCFHLIIWLGIGLPYWKWLGWW